jgi:hypothetical protein
MAKRTTQSDGPQFVQYFGPLLDTLRALVVPRRRVKSSLKLPTTWRSRMRCRMM